jgi:hypothetical protein
MTAFLDIARIFPEFLFSREAHDHDYRAIVNQIRTRSQFRENKRGRQTLNEPTNGYSVKGDVGGF